MPNVGNIIRSHNKSILEDSHAKSKKKTCNCKNGEDCPMGGNCLEPSIVYGAAVITPNNVEPYVGISEPPFKSRLYVHNLSFNDRKYSNTELSKKVWEHKDRGINYRIKWRKIQRAIPYSGGGGTCDLCTSEKLHILKTPNTLNSRNEIVSKCRHTRKFLIFNAANSVT